MILALHGFLGLPRDWAPFQELGETRAIDLWPSAQGAAADAFENWADSFLGALPTGERSILLGYSLGGRLAMHAAIRAPERFSACILISANPGLINEAEREPRRLNDNRWAERFLSEPWNDVVREWNAQPVLRTPPGVTNAIEESRPEREFERARLAWALRNWSLAEQRDLRAELARLPMPVMYLSGRSDVKFTQILSAMPLPSHHQHAVVEGAGHRLPWDQPAAFTSVVSEFINDM